MMEIDHDMRRNALILGIVLGLLVSACAAQATPTINPVDVQNTAVAAAFTMVAQTEQAMPTSTPLPPTATPTMTLLPTNTPIASPTVNALFTPSIQTAVLAATITPQSSGSGQDPCNQPLPSWQGPSANLAIANETKPQGTIVLSLYVVTDLGQCGFLYVVSDSLTGPVGQYSAGAFVTGKQNFKVFGGFRITEGNWKIVVRNDSITALGGCYPNC
jgi:hypothetical protein